MENLDYQHAKDHVVLEQRLAVLEQQMQQVIAALTPKAENVDKNKKATSVRE